MFDNCVRAYGEVYRYIYTRSSIAKFAQSVVYSLTPRFYIQICQISCISQMLTTYTHSKLCASSEAIYRYFLCRYVGMYIVDIPYVDYVCLFKCHAIYTYSL